MNYNQISVDYKAFELCFFWPENTGIETLEGLYNWEAKDTANRKLFEVKDRNEAQNIINSKSKLKSLI